MKQFFKENKIFLAILIGVLIVGAVIYFSLKKEEIDMGQSSVKTCQNLPELPDGAVKLVTKVIDGDTFLIEGGYLVRILGVDADEKGYPCYEKAKNRLEELILNKEVILEKNKENFDQYCRYLRYVFFDGKNVSLELIKEGLVVARFSPEDVKYREEIVEVERKAREKKIGCKWSFYDKTSKNESSFTKGTEDKSEKSEFQWEKLTTEKLGPEVVGACLAGKYVGKEMIVEGKIVDSYRHLKSNTVFLNFEKPYPNQCFTGVIFSSNLYKFVQNPEDYYLNKTVRIVGVIKEYKHKPQIILNTPDQIEVGK